MDRVKRFFRAYDNIETWPMWGYVLYLLIGAIAATVGVVRGELFPTIVGIVVFIAAIGWILIKRGNKDKGAS